MRRQAVRWCMLLAGIGAVLVGCSTAVKAPSPPNAGAAQAETFWQPDNPAQMPDTAFGTLIPDRTIITEMDGHPQTFSIRRFALDAPLPEVPERLPVYMTGSYPTTHTNPLLSSRGWQYVAAYSIVSYQGAPLTPPSGDTPAARAAALLKQYRLLEADSAAPTVLTFEDGSAGAAFFRHVNGLPVYGDKPACVEIDANGQVPWLHIRRRPLVEVSRYPTVSPQQAWERLQSGQFTKPSTGVCQDGAPPLAGEIAEFKVKSVELAYWEPHVDEGRQVMMPYHVFRDEQRHTLYVPAVESAPIAHPAGSVRESPLTATLRNSAGRRVKVYLYASDERVETVTTPSCMANNGDTLRTGHYSLYSEREGDEVPRPQGLTPFGSAHLSFNDHRPNYMQVLPGAPDLLLLTQYGSCNGDILAVLAPSRDGTELVQYRFKTEDGRVSSTKDIKGVTFPEPGKLQTSFYNNATGMWTTTTWEVHPEESMLVAVKTEVK